MPQFNLTVNNKRGIIQAMPAAETQLESLPGPGQIHRFRAASLRLSLPQTPKTFYRHGWQSWSLTTWIDPAEPPLPVRAAEFRIKDEDPGFALHSNPIAAHVGAVELGENDILLVGSLGLSGRVELDGLCLHGFFEDEHDGLWLIARGAEDDVFAQYVNALRMKFGTGQLQQAPRVWCSWYSLYGWINERVMLKALHGLGDLPFDVFQLDNGWQVANGDWEVNSKFPSGMQSLAQRISDSGRVPGLWLAPFLVSSKAQLVKDHPQWLLYDERGTPASAGITWTGKDYALDITHPDVLSWLGQLIKKVRKWGYNYLKLDYLYLGGLIGKRYRDIPREVAYRHALRVMREAAGDAYILVCGAPIVPSLGLCDGIRIGPDVSPFWVNKPLTVWLNNPNDTSTQNAIRTSIHRLWLSPIVNVDPDVMFFSSSHHTLTPAENQLLRDLGTIAGFKATSDLPHWLSTAETNQLRMFLQTEANVQKRNRYEYRSDGRQVDFRPAIPIPSSDRYIPIWLAKYLGLLKIIRRQALPAMWESRFQP